MLITIALEKFLVQLAADGRSLHTRHQYARHVRKLATWLEQTGRGRQVEKIDHEDLAQFLSSPAARKRPDGEPKKSTSTNALRTSVRCFFRYVHQAGYISKNPSRLIQRARCGAPHPRALSEQEQKRLLDALAAGEGPEAERDRLLFRTMLLTGIRIGSALGLDIEDIDLECGELRLRRAKGDREECVFMPDSLRADLEEFIGDRTSGPLFMGRGGARLCTRHVSRRFRQWLKVARIRSVRGTHTLRHSFATRLYEQSGDIVLVQRALTHRSIVSTLTYARADEARLRKALAG